MAQIVRIQYVEGKSSSKIIVNHNATWMDWNNLLYRAWGKCNYSRIGIPSLTTWKNKFSIGTKTGHSFEFRYIR